MFIVALSDFEMLNTSVTFIPDFLENHTICRNISIMFDNVLEDVEEFFILINTTDPDVQILQSNASIFIFDNSGKLSYTFQPII